MSESYGCLSRPDTPHLFDIDWRIQVSVHQRLKLLQKAKQNFDPKRLALKSSSLRIRVSPCLVFNMGFVDLGDLDDLGLNVQLLPSSRKS